MPSVLLAEGVVEFTLVRDFAIIMAVAGAVVVLFRKFNQPPILGYLMAGLIVGPFTLPTPLISDAEIIRLLADLGLVLLLFALGLEFGWRRIRQVGPSVLIIGGLEILSMISLGYWVGRLLGWTAQESIFLGAALSISSSAILVKVLRDTGQLATIRGRLIVGILVLEDFAAVILLTLLSGIASTGTAELRDVGLLVMKLAIFAIACLALGAVFVPRIIRLVAGFGSRETLLLASLALCFVLALLGQSLGISPAAGAFLIGAVVGDTEESQHIVETVEPIRDMFAALFFVSIGMLIDIRLIWEHIVPALIISAVFMAGKVVANTVGTFISGQGGRVPIQVGMGMPQIGEFSLAMMKVGAEQEAIRGFLYQVVAGVTAITSLLYPYAARSADGVAILLERKTPRWLRHSFRSLSVALQALRHSLTFDSEFARIIRRAAVPIVINFLIIVVLIGTGTFAARFGAELAPPLGIPPGIVANFIGLGTLTLCIPSAIGIWRGLQNLANEVTSHSLIQRRFPGLAYRDRVRNIIRDALLAWLVFVIGIWTIPLLVELLSLGSLALPVALMIVAVLGFIAVKTLTHMQAQLESTFSATFVGGAETNVTSTPGAENLLTPIGPHGPVPAESVSEFELAGVTDPVPIYYGEDSAEDAVTQITPSDAERIALAAVAQDQSPYLRRLKGRELAWEVTGTTQLDAGYQVTLALGVPDDPGVGDGVEEVLVDHAGIIRRRRIRRWPGVGLHRTRRRVIYVSAVAIVIVGIVAGISAFLIWGPAISLPIGFPGG
ncbi:MAG TPA: cation:proton antiporter [Dehalococcoidia bacterium]|nr:cation:proton antiporter [Dehalococcoidia bacterium]